MAYKNNFLQLEEEDEKHRVCKNKHRWINEQMRVSGKRRKKIPEATREKESFI